MPETIKRPMLASLATDFSKIKYPVLASRKLDGIRAMVIDGKLLSRSFKPIRNEWVQNQFAGLPGGLDGELICGDPTDKLVYRKTDKAVMARDGEPTEVVFWVFDNFTAQGGFQARFEQVKRQVYAIHNVRVRLVEHVLIHSAEELEAFEAKCIEEGYEGAMVRSLNGPYKENRSSEKEGFLLKIKRFIDFEAVVLDSEEGMHNANVATKDNLGLTKRSSAKDGLIPNGTLGKVIARALNGPYEGKEFGVGTGFTGQERVELWKDRPALVGRTIKVKCAAPQASGGYDLPRFPTFLGFRDASDMD